MSQTQDKTNKKIGLEIKFSYPFCGGTFYNVINIFTEKIIQKYMLTF